jgi:hypothetical protein
VTEIVATEEAAYEQSSSGRYWPSTSLTWTTAEKLWTRTAPPCMT